LTATRIEAINEKNQRVKVTDENFHEIVKKLVSTDTKGTKKGSNLQNIASKGDGVKVRGTFVPRKGWFFIGSDLGQIEPRIQAHIMYVRYGDNSMRSIFVAGVDLYTTMAIRVFKLDEKYCVDKAYDPTGRFQPRKMMKQGVLAKSYGQTPQAFARNMKVGEDVAKEFFTSFDEQFPSFTKMVEDIKNGMIETGYVETLFGRKRRFPEYKQAAREVKKNERKLMSLYIERKRLTTKVAKTPKELKKIDDLNEKIKPMADLRGMVAYWERAAFNAVIQGTGADILKANMIQIKDKCVERGWELNASIHDEVKISVPRADLTPETIEIVREAMTKTIELSVPLVTDTVIEPKWQEEYAPDEWDFENARPIPKEDDEQ
jgi:DNA polymerase I